MPLGIYHDPELWFSDGSPGSASDPFPHRTVYEEIVAGRKIENISIAVSRDGMFEFDFSKWPEYRGDLIERRARQLKIMNAYLLCFYCAVATRGLWMGSHRQSIPMMR
jgi:hypothetical protein